jgi:quercetin dioxygenase-like cupin family protein
MKTPSIAANAVRTRRVACSFLGASLLACLGAPSFADHGLPHPELLARGTFVDNVAVTIRDKIAGRETQVMQIQNASDIVVLRISIEAGGIAPWHDHTGTGFLVNLGPGVLTNYVGEDCIPRDFYPGDAFIDPGHGDLHAVRNDSEEPIVLVATFLGIEGAPVLPEPEPEACADVL